MKLQSIGTNDYQKQQNFGAVVLNGRNISEDASLIPEAVTALLNEMKDYTTDRQLVQDAFQRLVTVDKAYDDSSFRIGVGPYRDTCIGIHSCKDIDGKTIDGKSHYFEMKPVSELARKLTDAYSSMKANFVKKGSYYSGIYKSMLV